MTSKLFIFPIAVKFVLFFESTRVFDENPETSQIQAKGPSGEGQSP